MGNKLLRSKLYKISPYCRNCGIKTLIYGDPNSDSFGTIQHNRFRHEENYNNDLTLFCNKCNRKDNTDKLKSYNLSYNSLKFPNLPHDKINKNLKTIFKNHISGNFIIDNLVISICNGCIMEIYDECEFKLKMLKIYMVYNIYTKEIIKKTFENFYNIITKSGKHKLRKIC